MKSPIFSTAAIPIEFIFLYNFKSQIMGIWENFPPKETSSVNFLSLLIVKVGYDLWHKINKLVKHLGQLSSLTYSAKCNDSLCEMLEDCAWKVLYAFLCVFVHVFWMKARARPCYLPFHLNSWIDKFAVWTDYNILF